MLCRRGRGWPGRDLIRSINNKGDAMKTSDRIEAYNKNNPGYNITGIKKMDLESIEARRKYGARSLEDLYIRPSDAKRSSYNYILKTYAPADIIALAGSCRQYSVLLKAGNGDILHITRANTYLIDVEDARPIDLM